MWPPMVEGVIGCEEWEDTVEKDVEELLGAVGDGRTTTATTAATAAEGNGALMVALIVVV